MRVVEFREPTQEDVSFIANTMRPADVDEVWASNRKTPEQALIEGYNRSRYCVCMVVEGTPVAIFGLVVADILSGTGVPWMLASTHIMRSKRLILELSPQVLSEMVEICPTLYNYVHAKNHVSIRWLKWLGFEFDEAIPYGPDGELFHRFYRLREH